MSTDLIKALEEARGYIKQFMPTHIDVENPAQLAKYNAFHKIEECISLASQQKAAPLPAAPDEKEFMKVISPVYGYPDKFPMELFNEEQAQKNHGQSLKRLNERGGLAASEMLANIQRRAWTPVDNTEAIIKVLQHWKELEETQSPTPSAAPSMKWVKADQKPEHNVGVLVFIPDEDFHITSGMWDISNKWVLLDEYRVPECEVTHWMPLPQIPTEYKKEQDDNNKAMSFLKKYLPESGLSESPQEGEGKCKGCGHTNPADYSLRTTGYCYLCDGGEILLC